MEFEKKIACMHCSFEFVACVHADSVPGPNTIFAVTCPNCGKETNFDGAGLTQVDACDPTSPLARVAAP